MTYKSDVHGTFQGRGDSHVKVTGTVMLQIAFEALTVDFAYAEVDLLDSLQVLISFPYYFNKENIRSTLMSYHAYFFVVD